MSKIDKLLKNYRNHISIPWQETAPAQRVIFCVYNEKDERKLRAKIDEFELTTKEVGHGWLGFDLTDTFADWLSEQRYAKRYFQQSNLLSMLFPNYLTYLVDNFKELLEKKNVDNNTVVALKGVGSLFGILKVKEVVDKLAPLVPGRLLVFFPGSYEQNNYRLLDGYDGWNYLAVPITANKDF